MTTAAELHRQLAAADTAARAAVTAADTVAALDEAVRIHTGKRSVVAAVKDSIKALDAAERPAIGQALAAYTAAVEELAAARRDELAARDAERQVGEERLDLSLAFTHGYARGHLHLVTQIQRELEDIFVGMGYEVAYGPEVETDWYNFESLNFPPGHPARAMQDTLYVELGEPEEVLLRTHTSPMQIRLMESRPPPVYAVMPGRVYRRDTLDARHSPVFHQIEGLAVDRDITMADMVGTIEAFLRALFGEETRARVLPSFFPFTEPSAEFAATCPFCHGEGCTVCSQTGWIELGGCGMVDPNVFLAVGYDPEEVQGFAFGFGIDRLAQLRHGVDHVKTLWDDDVRFLAQF